MRASQNNMSRSGVYRSWYAMIARCTRPRNDKYKFYGGRGIKVCDRWLEFKNFYADMGDRPEGMSLDRINNDGNYEPGNCRWATDKQQKRNRSSNRRLTAFGETKTVPEWGEDARCSVPTSLVMQRVDKLKWDHEWAVSAPLGSRRTRPNDN